jgi:hypothetical protein
VIESERKQAKKGEGDYHEPVSKDVQRLLDGLVESQGKLAGLSKDFEQQRTVGGLPQDFGDGTIGDPAFEAIDNGRLNFRWAVIRKSESCLRCITRV